MQQPDTARLPTDASATSPAGAAQALQALSRSGSARTQMARLRELLPEIEAAQAAGVRHAHILEALNAHGFALSMKSYSVMLHRLRQQRARAGGASAPSGAEQPAAPIPAPAPAALSAKTSGNPQPPAAPLPSMAPPHHPDAGPTQAATPGPSPGAQPAAGQIGQPHNFDWEALKNVPPEW